MAKNEKEQLAKALETVKKIISRQVINSINSGDFTNARKYTTTCKHLSIAADFLGK